MADKRAPNLNEEKSLWTNGFTLVAGIDEVGRGCLAGPVAAGAVILPQKLRGKWLKEVRDSKMLTAKARERLSEKIKEAAVCYAVGFVPPRVIDSIGILNATRLAMKKAIESLKCQPQSILIDYLVLPDVSLPQKGVEDGDTICMSIACASIVAKVTRDAVMVKFDRIYPGYNFVANKGYCTEEHVDQLEKLGFCPIHRLSFHPQRMLPGFEEAVSEEHEA